MPLSVVYVFTRLLADADESPGDLVLALTAEDRTRSKHRFTSATGEDVYLNLPRGTVLQGGDRLAADEHAYVLKIEAKPEAVMTVRATQPQALMRAAYHLGNRHVALEVAPGYLRLLPDPVLVQMLQHLGVEVLMETAPFQPETGAYGHHAH